jgi:hypothetical protein
MERHLALSPKLQNETLNCKMAAALDTLIHIRLFSRTQIFNLKIKPFGFKAPFDDRTVNVWVFEMCWRANG